MAKIVLTPDAHEQIQELPRPIALRVYDVLQRLKRWPQVSGAKPLRHGLKGLYRIRTGDWRIIFQAIDDEIQVVRIEHRKDVYER